MRIPRNFGRRVRIYEEVSSAVKLPARLIVDHLNRFGRLNIGLATGGTMEPVLETLVFNLRIDRPNLDNVFTWNMDEHLCESLEPVPLDHPLSYRGFMNRNLFDHVQIPKANIRFPIPDLTRPDDMFHDYVDSLYETGGLDFQLAGIGENGHIAYNEPDDCTEKSVTRVVRVSDNTIAVNSRYGEVPPTAGTIGTYELLYLNRMIIICAFGKKKAPAVHAALEGPPTWSCPASMFRWPYHRNVLWLLNTEAALMLDPNGPYERAMF